MKIARICVAIALLIAAVLLLVLPAESEDYDAWVLCQPDSFVYARMSPKKTSPEIGYLMCGDHFITDGKTKNGFLHVYDLNFELSEGWVHKGYVVYDEPYKPDVYETTVQSNGRVQARRTIGGKRRCWLKDGQKLKVYMVTDEWAVTSKGFVKTKYIDLGR